MIIIRILGKITDYIDLIVVNTKKEAIYFSRNRNQVVDQ